MVRIRCATRSLFSLGSRLVRVTRYNNFGIKCRIILSFGWCRIILSFIWFEVLGSAGITHPIIYTIMVWSILTSSDFFVNLLHYIFAPISESTISTTIYVIFLVKIGKHFNNGNEGCIKTLVSGLLFHPQCGIKIILLRSPDN